MKSTSLFLAAAFALCANAAFAQTTPGTTTTTPGTMNQTPNTTGTMTPGTTGTMNTGTTGTMSNGSMNNGTMNNGTMGTDRATMRSNRRAAKGSKMKSKTSTGTM